MNAHTIIAPGISSPTHVLLWTVELEKDEQLWIEAHYFSGQVIVGRVQYGGKALRHTNSNSGEYVEIPNFIAIGVNNPLLNGEVLKYRLWRS
jgi:hypothetical protein